MGQFRTPNPVLNFLYQTLKQRSTPLLIAVTALMVTGLLMALRQGGRLQSLELMVFDRLMQLRSERPPSDRILMVAITEPDLRRYGWPIPDRDLAQALGNLQRHSPRMIGLDIYRDLPQEPGYEALVEQMQAGNFVAIADVGAGIPPPPAVEANQVGFNDLLEDPDGVVRRGLLFVPGDEVGSDFYAFSLRLALGYLQKERSQPNSNMPLFELTADSQALVIRGQPLQRLQVTSGGYEAIDNGGYQVLLDYHAPEALAPVVSFEEVWLDQVPEALIRDRVIIIGSTAPSLQDGFRTPYSSGNPAHARLPGVWIHAQLTYQVLTTVLDRQVPFHYWADAWEWLWIGSWVLASSVLGWWSVPRPLVGIGLFGFLLFSVSFLTHALFLYHIWIPLATPLLGMGLGAIALVAYRAYQFQQQQQMVMRLLGQNTSPEIAQALWEQRDRLLKSGKLPGQRLIATMMFADIRNFSTTAESMTPEELMDWLNQCLEPVTEAIQAHHGIVNKFTGDGFMAVFGLPMARVPAEVSQDAQQAVACALEIAAQLRILNHKWQPQQRPLMQMRIGIFTGPVTAGSLGGKHRMEYGIIGDSVNIASRLESCAKERHIGTCRILLGQETYDLLEGKFKVEDWGPMALKGKAQMVNVYRVVDVDDPEEQFLTYPSQ